MLSVVDADGSAGGIPPNKNTVIGMLSVFTSSQGHLIQEFLKLDKQPNVLLPSRRLTSRSRRMLQKYCKPASLGD